MNTPKGKNKEKDKDKVRIKQADGSVKEVNIYSNEYRQLYDKVKSWDYDKETDSYTYSTLPEATVKATKLDKNRKLYETTPSSDLDRYYDNMKKEEMYGDELRIRKQMELDKLRKLKEPKFNSDTRSKSQVKADQLLTDRVNNPTFGDRLLEAGQAPLRYMAEPSKFVGDLVSQFNPNTTLPTTIQDGRNQRQVRLSNNISNEDKLNYSVNTSANLGTEALLNAGVLEFGYALPRTLQSSSLRGLFTNGSKANFTSDLIQLSQTNLDNVKQGDMNEIANMILNTASLFSKLDNFDASTVASNIRNWNNISTIDKLDTYKDLLNLGQAVNQQVQRKPSSN